MSHARLVWFALVCASCGAASPTPRTPEPAPKTPEPLPKAEKQRIEASPHVALGIPVDGDSSNDYLMDKGSYVLSYDDALHDPRWVAWRLTSADLGDEDRSDDFRADDELPAAFLKIGPKDYAHSGFDRGHMCPSAHRTNDHEQNSLTFLMTNMQPQVHALNAGPWKSLETYERQRALEGKVLFVVAGGLFGPEPKRIGPGIAVPRACFRITVVLGAGEGPSDVTDSTPVLGAIFTNDDSAKGHDWEEFRVPIDEIEQRTGYDFLSRLEDGVEARLEARAPAG